MGFAVTNSVDEPNGLASIGLASGGFIPNFADKGEPKNAGSSWGDVFKDHFLAKIKDFTDVNNKTNLSKVEMLDIADGIYEKMAGGDTMRALSERVKNEAIKNIQDTYKGAITLENPFGSITEQTKVEAPAKVETPATVATPVVKTVKAESIKPSIAQLTPEAKKVIKKPEATEGSLRERPRANKNTRIKKEKDPITNAPNQIKYMSTRLGKRDYPDYSPETHDITSEGVVKEKISVLGTSMAAVQRDLGFQRAGTELSALQEYTAKRTAGLFSDPYREQGFLFSQAGLEGSLTKTKGFKSKAGIAAQQNLPIAEQLNLFEGSSMSLSKEAGAGLAKSQRRSNEKLRSFEAKQRRDFKQKENRLLKNELILEQMASGPFEKKYRTLLREEARANVYGPNLPKPSIFAD
jgi:hypothetical protein